jgi:glutathione peroxidase
LRRNSELFDAKKGEAKEIPWNFAKFLVDSEGKVVSYHDPRVLPNELEKNIEEIIRKADAKQ